MHWTLKRKIVALAVLSAALPVVVMTVLILAQKTELMRDVTVEMNAIVRNDIGELARLFYQMCEMSNRGVERRVREHLATATNELARRGAIRFEDRQAAWPARNQETHEEFVTNLPVLCLGDTPLTPNAEVAVPSPVVDTVTEFTRAYCTVFQRLDEDGAMLRVATTVPDAAGRRAIGTFIPRRGPDGLESPVLAAVLRGESYVGRARVLDTWHAAAYAPIWDSPSRGRVIGMVYVGFPLEDIHRELHQAVLSIKVGTTGYAYVLGATGSDRGRYIISKGGELDGTVIWDEQDADGRYFVRDIVESALNTTGGVPAYVRYAWKHPSERAARMKVAAVTYFEPWDWVIGAGMYEDDYHGVLAHLDAAVDRLLLIGPLGGVVVLLLAVMLALLIGAAIARPIGAMVDIARSIAEGRLADADAAVTAFQARRAGPASDEPGRLFEAVSRMTRGLSSLVGQVQRSSVQLVSTATGISSAARQQETAVAEFGASTTEVTAAVKEISATSQALVRTMQDVKAVAADTEGLADTGRAGLKDMADSMQRLAGATASISQRLAVINEKTSAITAMVTTISKVADQTNLLSLNAAIEAEKAGEFGQGFAVVAREIRRLADQTAVASLEIEQTVREMQTSVASGVMEMDKFTGDVGQGVRAVSDIGARMERIIEQVKVLAPRFESVNEGMQAQSTGARQISDAMAQLGEGVSKTRAALDQFNEATAQLQNAARALQQEIARFKVQAAGAP